MNQMKSSGKKVRKKSIWKRMGDFYNGYVWVRSWTNPKTKEMWQVSDTYGGKGGDAIYVKKPFGVAVVKEFPSYKKALEFVAKKVGCSYIKASAQSLLGD